MIYLQLFWEFAKIGLFAVGGGMATLPFLERLSEKTGWFAPTLIADMVAISESTPGPIGINMATYVGFTVAGIPGAIIATLGEVSPAIVIIVLIAKLLNNFRENKYVDRSFYGLRPASTGLIGAALITVCLEVLLCSSLDTVEGSLLTQLNWSGQVNWQGVLLAAILLALTNVVKPTKKLHPIAFIAASAVIGAVLRF